MRTLENLRYYRGGEHRRETVGVDIINQNEKQNTSCIINVNLFLCKIWAYPCQDGSDIEFTPAERVVILKFIQAEREKITSSYPIKTRQAWHDSGLSKFEDFCFPGDEVDGEMVEYFINAVPPIKMSSQCVQEGEPHSTEFDNNVRRYRNTYATFHSISGGKWIFDGYCFYRENTNRYTQPSRIEELIAAYSRDISKDLIW